MTTLFSMLFRDWCVPYDPDNVPECMRGDPVTAYGQYTFEAGFKLAAGLLFLSLDPRDLGEIQ